MRVKTRPSHVLVVFAPGSRRKIRLRLLSRRPWTNVRAGDVLQVGGERLRVVVVAREGHHTTALTEYARAPKRRAMPPRAAKVIPMPIGDSSVVSSFLRFHVLVRVFDGDPDAWLAQIAARPPDARTSGDVRFIRWIRCRLRGNPGLLAAIRRMVDSAPLWRAARA